jgi:hypothetical protein
VAHIAVEFATPLPWKELMVAIQFNATLTQSDWDERLGAWKCDALAIPGAEVTALYENGAKRDDRAYRVDGNHIFWSADERPAELVLRIQIPSGLSTLEDRKLELDRERFAAEQDKTRIEHRWKIISAGGAVAGAVLSALITLMINRPASNEQMEDGRSQPPAATVTTADGANVLPSVSLTVIPNVFQQQFTRDAIRKPQGLRPLSALESGRTVAELPRQTYAFIWGRYLTKDREDATDALLAQPVERTRRLPTETFEIQRLAAGDTVLVVFCSNSASSEVANLDGIHRKNLLFFSDPWAEAPTLLLLPLNRIAEATTRNVETDDRVRYSAIEAVVW